MANTKGEPRPTDNTQDRLRDTRRGAYDPVGNETVPDTSQPTPHERAQPGGAMQGEPVPARTSELPAGLKRARKGPYGRKSGRREERGSRAADDVPTDGKEALRRREETAEKEKAEGDRRE